MKLALDIVLRHEGGYVNDPRDPGGATHHGISLRWLKDQGLEAGDVDGDGDIDAADIKALTPDQAAELYREKFWTPLGLDALPAAVAVSIMDFAVNAGPRQSVKDLQRACTLLGQDLVADGAMGPKTRAAVAEVCSGNHGAERLAATHLLLRCRFYATLAGKRPALAAFLRGWVLRAVAVGETALGNGG
jgi:lysozyme family protein